MYSAEEWNIKITDNDFFNVYTKSMSQFEKLWNSNNAVNLSEDFINKYKISSVQLNEMEIENNNFVVTGKFAFGRENVENFILKNGGILKPGITSKINFVIIGEDYGWSKIQKINDLNENKKTEIKILTEMELQEIIKKYGT